MRSKWQPFGGGWGRRGGTGRPYVLEPQTQNTGAQRRGGPFRYTLGQQSLGGDFVCALTLAEPPPKFLVPPMIPSSAGPSYRCLQTFLC